MTSAAFDYLDIWSFGLIASKMTRTWQKNSLCWILLLAQWVLAQRVLVVLEVLVVLLVLYLGQPEICVPRVPQGNRLLPKSDNTINTSPSRETLRFEGNKIYCSPGDQSLSDLLYSKTRQKQILKNMLRFLRQHQATFNCTLWSRATAVNISRGTVNCFPFDVIVFAMLPAHGIWRETVSLLDVMWPWTSQWMGAL